MGRIVNAAAFQTTTKSLEPGGTLAESLNDAYIEAVKALGGSKVVGAAIWPAKGVDAAQRHLLACLNPDRNEKLSPEEALHIERMARNRGCHVIAVWRNRALDYAEPVPVEPKDIADDLQRQAIEMGRQLTEMLARLEKVRGGGA
jgi:hypothetical protein